MLVDTRAVSLPERFDYWAAHSCELFHPVDLRPEFERPFSGVLMGSRFGPLEVFKLTADASRAARTAKGIASFDPERLLVAVQTRGECVVAQGGRQASLRVGDVVSYASSQPYTMEANAPFEVVIFTIPRLALGADAGRLYRSTATRVPGDIGLAPLAVPFLRRIASALSGEEPPGDFHLAEAVVDLVRGLYAGRPGPAPSTTPPPITARVKSYMETNIVDPELRAARIAAANAISERYLYKLFAAEGESVQAWIRERRLERCRRDLANPELRDETISEIAARWGWKSAAHFSRCFHDQYGSSPRAYRSSTWVGVSRLQRPAPH